MTYWLAWEEPRAVGDLVHVEKFFARNLGGLIHARTRVPGRLGKATSRTSSMYVDEKSDAQRGVPVDTLGSLLGHNFYTSYLSPKYPSMKRTMTTAPTSQMILFMRCSIVSNCAAP